MHLRRIGPWFFAAVSLLLAACAPHYRPPGLESATPRIADDAFVMTDGTRLPRRVWQPEKGDRPRPAAVIVALHGFNDYSRAFKSAGRWWAKQGVVTHAYDQRGFGETREAGYWPTGAALQQDLRTVLRLLHARYEKAPIFVVGESMGGAVAIAALAGPDGGEPADGVILAAPAVWGWSSMNPFYRIALWWGAHLFPGMRVTGESLDIRPSDNIAMLRDLAADPLVIKKTRIDAIYGLVDLMETASEKAGDLAVPTLLLYGGKDEIISDHAVARTRQRLSGYKESGYKEIVYENGYHMLLRDCQAPLVWADILEWIGAHRPGAGGEGMRVSEPESRRHSLCREAETARKRK